MFDKKLFNYDPQTHTGYYNGKIVPSVTQIVDIVYPMDSDIPESRLKNAAERGTAVHKQIEEINQALKDNGYNLSKAIDMAIKTNNQESIDYVSVLNAYKLKPVSFEELVFLLDKNGELICYGHYDLVALCEEDNILFENGHLHLLDVKTTSVFDKRKVALQLSIYATAYEQAHNVSITGIGGLWLRDGVKIMPLERSKNELVIAICSSMAKIFVEGK